MIRNKKNTLIGLCILIVCFFLWGVYLHSNRPPSIYWGQNARLMYNFSARTYMLSPGDTVMNNSRMMYGTVNITGILNFRVFDIDSKKIRVGIELTQVQIESAQTRDGQVEDRISLKKRIRDKQLEDMFSRMFYVLFSPDGRMLSFDFSNEIAEDDRKSIEGLMRALQIVVTEINFFKSWSMEEHDKYGVYSSEYKYDSTLVKKRKKYLKISDSAGLKNIIQSIDIKKSLTNCEYGYPDTWLSNLDSDELTVFYKNKNDAVIKFSTTVNLKKIPYKPEANLSLWKNDRNPDSDISKWKSKPVERFSISEKKELYAINKHYGSTDFKQIMKSLLKKYTRFNPQCVSEILKYLKLFPEAAAEIPDFSIKDLNVHQKTMLVNVLQRDKSEYAQRALSRIIKGREFPPDIRIQSVVAAGDITKPDADFIKSLMNVYDSRNSREDLTIKLSDNAMLSLGRITRNLSYNKNADDEKIVEEIKGKIKSEFSSLKDPGQTGTVIYAAANTGDNNFIDSITYCFQSPASSVRAATARSLPLFNDEKIDSILIDQLKIENDVNVKMAIVKSLYVIKASDKAVETVCGKMQSEENEMVRSDMYRFLLKNRSRAGVKDILGKMLVRENSIENRNIISRALFSKK